MSSSTFYIASQQEDLRDSGMGEVPKHLSVSHGLHCSNLFFDLGLGKIFWCSNMQFG